MISAVLRKLRLIFLPVVMCALSGCVYVVIGTVGALGGYIVSPDTVEGILEFEQSEVWDSTVEIISIMGTISERNDQGGLLIAKVAGAKVTVNVAMMSANVSKVTIKARRAFFPKIKLAQEIYTKIASRLSE